MIHDKEPIIALATPSIKSALHIIRLSGLNILKIVSKIFSEKIINDKVRNIHVGFLKDKNKIIDQVVLLTYIHPNSYTGEDVVEIICHGNAIIDNEIIDLFISKGVRMATNGEFTYRAFINGKLDLIKAESINDLINATTLESKQICMHSMNGDTSKLLIPIKNRLISLISNIEVNIDYPEYKNIEKINRKKIFSELFFFQKKIKEFIKNGNKNLIIKNGINVVIIGKPNVGKSTLLNCLINKNKAIVTNIPGTTRDIVEDEVVIDGILFHILDTAGIRNSNDKIETLGIKKTFEAINKADIIIYLKDNLKDNDIKILNNDKKIIEVINKSDLLSKKNKKNNKYIYISALKNKNINLLIDKIKNVLNIKSIYNKASFANVRELALLKKSNLLINKIFLELKNQTSMDIILTLLNNLLNIFLEIFGDKISFDIVKEIFSRFCIGK